MAMESGCSAKSYGKHKNQERLRLKKYVTDTIVFQRLKILNQNFLSPAADPRERFEAFEFMKRYRKRWKTLRWNEAAWKVTNITTYGAFVDIGVHQDGLFTFSEITDGFIKAPLMF